MELGCSLVRAGVLSTPCTGSSHGEGLQGGGPGQGDHVRELPGTELDPVSSDKPRSFQTETGGALDWCEGEVGFSDG